MKVQRRFLVVLSLVCGLRTAASLIDVGSKKQSKEVASDPDSALLRRLYGAKMIEPYVLLSA